jgi:hypothetical protein
MNKKIEALAKQAGATTFGGKQCIFGDEDVEKFAQLIIDECVNVCLSQRNPQNLNYKPSVKFADEIKRHFW